MTTSLISSRTSIIPQNSSNSNSTLLIAFSIISTHLQAVHSLPIANFKKQEKYGVALRVQCVTLFDAGVLLDVICSCFLVTKSAVYRWKRIAKAQGYKLKIDPYFLCYCVKDIPRSSRVTARTKCKSNPLYRLY